MRAGGKRSAFLLRGVKGSGDWGRNSNGKGMRVEGPGGGREIIIK